MRSQFLGADEGLGGGLDAEWGIGIDVRDVRDGSLCCGFAGGCG